MRILKFVFGFLLFAPAIAIIATGGCGRAPVQVGVKDVKDKPPPPPPPPPFDKFLEAVRYPDRPRVIDDWTRYREAFNLVSSHFEKTDVSERLRLDAKEREFLERGVHLTPDELHEVEATSFRTADAHYVDECFLLRDAASRVLERTSLSPMEQAEALFGWTMRNVIVHEQVDTWVPPAFALRQGHAGAVDRALVFLALLRQAQIEGGLVVVPGSDPLQFLVAVHDVKGESLRLFDPRLEMPIRGKADRVATLKESLENPALLEPAMITPDQAKKLEVRLIYPLYALAPRLRELQDQLRPRMSDPVNLYLPASELHRTITKIAGVPVKVWNEAAPSGKKGVLGHNSPTRALRHFLPKSDGGVDDTNRLLLYADARFPLQNIGLSLTAINVSPDVLPRLVFLTLERITQDLLVKYDVQPRELYLRGKFEAMKDRHERLQEFARNDALAGLAEDPKFREELNEWRIKLREQTANLALNDEDPKIRAKAQLALHAIWLQDPFLFWLTDTEKDEKLDRAHKKTVLTRIFAVGLHDYFEMELARAQAAMGYEKAENLRLRMKSNPKARASAHEEARDAWIVTKSSWGTFYINRIHLDGLIKQRLDEMKNRIGKDDVDRQLRLLESLHLDVQKYFQGKLRYAESRWHADKEGEKAARTSYAETKAEIEAMEKAGLLRAEIKRVAESPNARPPHRTRLDLLERDWAERGHYFWMKRQIDERMR